jgi:hypothetical protein
VSAFLLAKSAVAATTAPGVREVPGAGMEAHVPASALEKGPAAPGLQLARNSDAYGDYGGGGSKGKGKGKGDDDFDPYGKDDPTNKKWGNAAHGDGNRYGGLNFGGEGKHKNAKADKNKNDGEGRDDRDERPPPEDRERAPRGGEGGGESGDSNQ